MLAKPISFFPKGNYFISVITLYPCHIYEK
nr:MAG TPA: hypothetical protein [Microviridae sp.]